MNSRLQEIVRRKHALIDKAARERAELAKAYANLPSPFDISGALLSLGHMLKTHPMITAGLSSLLVGGYARRALIPVTQVFKLWRVIRPVWRWWRKR